MPVWLGHHTINVMYMQWKWSAAQYVLSKFDMYASVSDMISLLGWPTLESRRNTLKMLMM